MGTTEKQVEQQAHRGIAVAAHQGGRSGGHATTLDGQADSTSASRASPPACSLRRCRMGLWGPPGRPEGQEPSAGHARPYAA